MRSTTEDQDRVIRGQPRRRVLRTVALAAVAAGPLSACGIFDDGPEPQPSPDPLAPLLDEALRLAEQYEATITAFPDLATHLSPVAQAHREHAAELARLTKTVLPSGSPTAAAAAPPTGDAKAALAWLRTAEQQARETAEQACLAAPAERAALLGSITAARATHLEVLR